MINLTNYVIFAGVMIYKDIIIMPNQYYEHLNKLMPTEKLLSWTHIDGWLHDVTGLDKFYFTSGLKKNNLDELYNWNKKTEQYE